MVSVTSLGGVRANCLKRPAYTVGKFHDSERFGAQKVKNRPIDWQNFPRENGVAVYCSYRGKAGEPLFEFAKAVGHAIGSTVKNGKKLFVVTGGGDGLMQAVATGCINEGSHAVGVGMPFGDYPLPKHHYPEYTVHPNFPLRLYGAGGFEHRSAYSMALPGGPGTLHEVMTKANELYYNHTIAPSQKQILLLDHQNFFSAPGGLLDHIGYLIQQGLTDPNFLGIFKRVQTPEEIGPCLLDKQVPWTTPPKPGYGVAQRKLSPKGL